MLHFLDEPTAALDAIAESQTYPFPESDWGSQEGIVILSTHIVSDIEQIAYP